MDPATYNQLIGTTDLLKPHLDQLTSGKFNPLLLSLLGDLLFSTVVFWMVLIALTLAAVEAGIVGFRLYRNETLFSALCLSGQSRQYREETPRVNPAPVLALPPSPSSPVVPVLVEPTGEDILEDMYAMKMGVLRVLREQRGVERTYHNEAGEPALEVLIQLIEISDPQQIWGFGSQKIKNIVK